MTCIATLLAIIPPRPMKQHDRTKGIAGIALPVVHLEAVCGEFCSADLAAQASGALFQGSLFHVKSEQKT